MAESLSIYLANNYDADIKCILVDDCAMTDYQYAIILKGV